MRKIALVIFILLGIYGSVSAESLNIIPFPSKVTVKQGVLTIPNELFVKYKPVVQSEVDYLIDILSSEYGITSSSNSKATKIELKLDRSLKKRLGQEGYLLSVKKNGIVLRAASNQGIFYGIQTLRQLIVKTNASSYFVRNLKIEDKPAFSWRAFMLDESRYFKGMEVVRQMLNEMARLKMNVFHWHLTNDQGWRIEIKKYPLLTEVGSVRDSTQIGVWPTGWQSAEYDGVPHGGYYTQDQIKEIIDYAAKRHITIIPEIEMPGHASAAIAAYPWLGTSKEKIKVPVKFGVPKDVFDVSDESVVAFLKDVLEEVIALFPSPVIHIGGDEVKYDHWQNSPRINAYMKENNIKTYADLQVTFTNYISNLLEQKGRRMMGWNEVMGTQLHEYSHKDMAVSERLAKNSVVHFWKGEIDLINEAVLNGYEIVNSYHEYTYLDYDYNKIPLSKSYGFNPIPDGVDPEYQNQILGLGCQMWCEWIPTVESMQKLVFPRLAAYAEVGWTPRAVKDYDRFLAGLTNLKQKWTEKNIVFTE